MQQKGENYLLPAEVVKVLQFAPLPGSQRKTRSIWEPSTRRNNCFFFLSFQTFSLDQVFQFYVLNLIGSSSPTTVHSIQLRI